MDINEEKKIVEAAKSNLQAFEKLYELYVRKIYSFVASMVGNNQNAEDIVSETFEKAMLNIDKFEYRGYTFGAWLYRIARNLVYDRSRARKEIPVEDEVLDYISVDNRSPDSLTQEGEEKELLYKMISKLNDEQKEVIILRYIQNYSIKEVCDMLDKTEDSVKSLAKRALANLRQFSSDLQLT